MNKLLVSIVLVVIVVGIILAIYFSTKKSGDGKPELTFDSNATKTINPQEESGGGGDDDGSEGYRIEYAGADESSKFIDLTLKWTNGQGFDGVVTKLIFTRTVDGTEIQAAQETTASSDISDNGFGKVTFKGSDVTKGSSVKGKNVITAYYNKIADVNKLASAEIEVTDDDFNFTIVGPHGDLSVPVSISEDEFKLTKDIRKTYYKFSHEPNQWRIVEKSGNNYKIGTEEFIIKNYKGRTVITNPAGDIFIDHLGFIKVENMTKDNWDNAYTTIYEGISITDYSIKQGFEASKSYISNNGAYRLEFQDDGNLVIRVENATRETEAKDTVVFESGSRTLGAKQAVLRKVGDQFWLSFSKSATSLSGSDILFDFRSTNANGENTPKLLLTNNGKLIVINGNGMEVNTIFGIDFITHKTGDRVSGDISATGNTTLEQCKAKCQVNNDCTGISYHAVDKICYEKGSTGKIDTDLLDTNYVAGGYQFYYKIPKGYEIQGAGDRQNGDLTGMPVTKNTLSECSDVCRIRSDCTGFSYNNKTDQCYAKKDGGLTEYKQTGFQYYRKT